MKHFLNTKAAGDIAMQFMDTMVRYGDNVITVIDNSDEHLWYRHPISGRAIQIDKDDPALDTTPLRLGYVDSPNGPLYLSRMGRRKWKQGLSIRDNLKVLNEQGRVVYQAGTRIPFEYAANGGIAKSIQDVLTQGYKSFQEALECVMADDQPPYAIFHKDWMMRCLQVYDADPADIVLFWKCKAVGTIHPDGEVELRDEYIFLHEALEAARA